MFRSTFFTIIGLMSMVICFLNFQSISTVYAKCTDFDYNKIGNRDINKRSTDLNLYSLSQALLLGKKLADELEQRTRFLEDEFFTSYISLIGNDIVKNSDGRILFKFRVIDSKEINLFAFPGGFIYVALGLLEEVDTEAELVGLLSHEISHVTARHATEELSRKWGFKKFLKKVPLFGLIPETTVRKKALGLSIDASLLGITTENERESDCLGIQYSWKTGYDPDGYLRFYSRIKQDYDLSGSTRYESFLKTHPFQEGKTEHLKTIARSLPQNKRFISSTTDFEKMKDLLIELKHKKQQNYITQSREYELAKRFAPLWHQEFSGHENADYFTNFDFDNDWIGDNNWDNLQTHKASLQANLYFSVIETSEYCFIGYYAFYPRDWKTGGSLTTNVKKGLNNALNTITGKNQLSDIMQRIKHSHENDFEGCIVVAQKNSEDVEDTILVALETFTENRFNKYRTKPFFGSSQLEIEYIHTDQLTHPVLFVEAKSHDIWGLTYNIDLKTKKYISLRHGVSEHSGKLVNGDTKTYELIPLYDTLWQKAHDSHGSQTIGKYYKYEDFDVLEFLQDSHSIQTAPCCIGTIGITLKGKKHGNNLAQLPWIWEDYKDLRISRGTWFFDPANTIKIHYLLEDQFSTAYIHHPFIGILQNSNNNNQNSGVRIQESE